MREIVTATAVKRVNRARLLSEWWILSRSLNIIGAVGWSRVDLSGSNAKEAWWLRQWIDVRLSG